MAFDARQTDSFHTQIASAPTLALQLAFSFGAKWRDDIRSNSRATGHAFGPATASDGSYEQAGDRCRDGCLE
jgi:hypothetical protein